VFRSKPKSTVPGKRVWRITASAPKGEWVTSGPPVAAKTDANLPEVSYGTWVTSSYDLLDGADVTEDAGTIPGDLFDELFAPQKAAPKGPGEGPSS
jgi:hypothetical protein